MLEVTLLNCLAGHVQFAVQIEAEAAVSVARKRDMRPRFGRDWSRRNNDVVNRAPDPYAEPAVVKVRVERARPGEDRILIVDARIEFHPAFDRERAAQRDVCVHIVTVAAIEAQHRLHGRTQFCHEPFQRGIVGQHDGKFVERVAIEFVARNRASAHGDEELLRARGRAGETIHHCLAQRRRKRGPDFEQRRNRCIGFGGGQRADRFALNRRVSTRRELTKDIDARRTGLAQRSQYGEAAIITGRRRCGGGDQQILQTREMETRREFHEQILIRITRIACQQAAEGIGQQRRQHGVVGQATAIVVKQAEGARDCECGFEQAVGPRFVWHRCDHQQFFV